MNVNCFGRIIEQRISDRTSFGASHQTKSVLHCTFYSLRTAREEVFVGRVRRDETQPRTLNMWIVSDNLRKGAATNAVQIAEVLLKNGWL